MKYGFMVSKYMRYGFFLVTFHMAYSFCLAQICYVLVALPLTYISPVCREWLATLKNKVRI